MDQTAHHNRITDLLSRLQETADRFTARIEAAGTRAEQAASGWTPAQIAVHVALVNRNLAGVIDGSIATAAPPAADFSERPWAEIVRDIPSRNESPERFLPAAGVTAAHGLAQFKDSVAHLTRAIGSLSEERAAHCFTTRTFGTITLYQAGDFAIAHMIRHNQQTKRILGA
jgi:hypothetical protein